MSSPAGGDFPNLAPPMASKEEEEEREQARRAWRLAKNQRKRARKAEKRAAERDEREGATDSPAAVVGAVDEAHPQQQQQQQQQQQKEGEYELGTLQRAQQAAPQQTEFKIKGKAKEQAEKKGESAAPIPAAPAAFAGSSAGPRRRHRSLNAAQRRAKAEREALQAAEAAAMETIAEEKEEEDKEEKVKVSGASPSTTGPGISKATAASSSSGAMAASKAGIIRVTRPVPASQGSWRAKLPRGGHLMFGSKVPEPWMTESGILKMEPASASAEASEQARDAAAADPDGQKAAPPSDTTATAANPTTPPTMPAASKSANDDLPPSAEVPTSSVSAPAPTADARSASATLVVGPASVESGVEAAPSEPSIGLDNAAESATAPEQAAEPALPTFKFGADDESSSTAPSFTMTSAVAGSGDKKDGESTAPATGAGALASAVRQMLGNPQGAPSIAGYHDDAMDAHQRASESRLALDRQIATMRDEITALKVVHQQDVESRAADQAEVSKLAQEREDLKRDLIEAQRSTRQREEGLQAQLAEVAKVAADTAALRTQLEQYVKKAEESGHNNDQLRGRLDTLEEQLTEERRKADEEAKRHREQLLRLENDNRELGEELDKFTQQTAGLEKAVAEAKVELEEAKRGRSDLEHRQNLQEQEVEKLVEQNQELARSLDQLRSKLEETEKELEEARDELRIARELSKDALAREANLTREVADLKAERSRLVMDVAQSVADFEGAMVSAEEGNSAKGDADATVSLSPGGQGESASASSAVQELQHDELQQMVRRKLAKVQETTAERDRLRLRLEEAGRAITVLTTADVGRSRELDSAKSQLEELTSQSGLQRAELSEKDGQIRRLLQDNALMSQAKLAQEEEVGKIRVPVPASVAAWFTRTNLLAFLFLLGVLLYILSFFSEQEEMELWRSANEETLQMFWDLADDAQIGWVEWVLSAFGLFPL